MMSDETKKRIENINAENAKFWKRENEAFDRLCEDHPEDIVSAAEEGERLARLGCVHAAIDLTTANPIIKSRRAAREAQAEVMRPDYERGKKTLESARAGHVAVHGTKAERQKKYSEWQKEIDRLCDAGLSFSRAAELVATQAGVNQKTVTRNTVNPKKT